MSLDTLWGSFETTEEPEKPVATIPAEEKPKETEEDLPKEEDVKEKSTEEKEDAPEEKKEEPKKEDTPDEASDDITETFNSVSGLLEEEELMYLPEDKEYDGDAKGFADMMRDNMEAQKKYLEEQFSKKESEIRASYEKASKPSFSEMDPEANSEELLTEYYKRTGLEEDEISEKLAELKDLDYLSKEAKVAKRYLSKEEDKENKAAQKEQELREKKKAEEIESYVSGLKAEIDNAEEMAGFKMTNKIKNGFKDYIFKQDKDGLTQAQKAGKDPNRRLRLAFLDYMDFNKKDFEIKAKTEVSNELKKKTSRFTSKGASAKGVSVETPKESEFNPGFLDFWSTGNNE